MSAEQGMACDAVPAEFTTTFAVRHTAMNAIALEAHLRSPDDLQVFILTLQAVAQAAWGASAGAPASPAAGKKPKYKHRVPEGEPKEGSFGARVLAWLRENEGEHMPGEIAEALDAHPKVVSMALAGLRKRGVIT